MTKFYYKCMKCRTRNIFNMKVDEYKIKRKCKRCNHNRFYWDGERNGRIQLRCYCSGYQHPHRTGAKFCTANKDSEFNIRTIRYGESPNEVKLDIAFKDGGRILDKDEDCPF